MSFVSDILRRVLTSLSTNQHVCIVARVVGTDVVCVLPVGIVPASSESDHGVRVVPVTQLRPDGGNDVGIRCVVGVRGRPLCVLLQNDGVSNVVQVAGW